MAGIFRLSIPFLAAPSIVIYHIPHIRSGFFQHFLLVASDFLSVTSLGTYGSAFTSTIMHEDAAYVNSIASFLSTGALQGRRLLDFQQGMDFWGAFGLVQGMLGQEGNIIAGGHSVPPFVLPPAVIRHVIAQVGEPPTEAERDYFLSIPGDVLPEFLAHNKFFCHMPLLFPAEVAAGAVILHNVPRQAGDAVTPQMYLDILRNIKAFCDNFPHFVFASGAFHYNNISSIVQNGAATVLTQGPADMVCYTSDDPRAASAYYGALQHMLREEFSLSKQEEYRHILSDHISAFERELEGQAL